jgi:hypothetical protein
MQSAEEDENVRARFNNFSGCLPAIHLRHREVHHNEVESKRLCLSCGIRTIHSFAANPPVGIQFRAKCATRKARADYRLQSKSGSYMFKGIRRSGGAAPSEEQTTIGRAVPLYRLSILQRWHDGCLFTIAQWSKINK